MRPLVLALSIAALPAPVAADAPRCRVTKIKDREVSIEVPVGRGADGDAECRMGAQRAAKQYAVDHPVCGPSERETTFRLTATWSRGGDVRTIQLRTYCPPLARRK